MIGKVKNFLGIESVKIKLEIPNEIPLDGTAFPGKVIFTSKTNQTVKSIKIKLIEKYTRGRRKKKLVNEYVAGVVEYKKPFYIEKDKEFAFEFILPYNIAQSEMDKIGSGNFITKGLVGIAKFLNNVKSEFRVEATAKVKGNAIPPLTLKSIKVV